MCISVQRGERERDGWGAKRGRKGEETFGKFLDAFFVLTRHKAHWSLWVSIFYEKHETVAVASSSCPEAPPRDVLFRFSWNVAPLYDRSSKRRSSPPPPVYDASNRSIRTFPRIDGIHFRWISVCNSRFFVPDKTIYIYIYTRFILRASRTRHLWIKRIKLSITALEIFLLSPRLNKFNRLNPIIAKFHNSIPSVLYFITRVKKIDYIFIRFERRFSSTFRRYSIRNKRDTGANSVVRESMLLARILYCRLYIYRPTNTCTHSCGHSYLAGSKWKHVFSLVGPQGRFLSPTMHRRLVMHTPLV